jgi:aspartate aminotransferase-like enzyme
LLTYSLPLVPGPVTVPQVVRAAYQVDFGSGDLEPEFLTLYAHVQAQLQKIMGTRNVLAVMTGEGMLALWAGLKSTVRPGDRVLCVATGVFGYGVADMARQVGAQVEVVSFGYDEIADPDVVASALTAFRPDLVTAIHCETPSGTLNPICELGQVVHEHSDALFYVDAVASTGGTALLVDEWGIDLGLVGSQKCLAAPPSISAVAVSDRAWQKIAEVNYPGYDALLPWRSALADGAFPYTPAWAEMAALEVSLDLLLSEGLENVFVRHASVAAQCRTQAGALGLELFPRTVEACSPTVTAIKVPEQMGWPELDRRLRAHGMAAGGSYGPLAGKVFRLGHMGPQADPALIDRASRILRDVLADWEHERNEI